MESKIWSGADICRVLFETKQGVPVEGYHHAVAGKPLMARATGRHTTELGGPPARLSFWVTKAIVEAVKGSKVEAIGLDRGRHWVKANGRVLAYDAEENTWYPVFFPAYLVCLLALGEAVSAPAAAHDLLEAYNALQYHLEEGGGEIGLFQIEEVDGRAYLRLCSPDDHAGAVETAVGFGQSTVIGSQPNGLERLGSHV